MDIDDDFEFSSLVTQTNFIELSHTFESITQQYAPDSQEHKALIIGLMAFQYVKQQWGLERFKHYLNNLDREPTAKELAAYEIMGYGVDEAEFETEQN